MLNELCYYMHQRHFRVSLTVDPFLQCQDYFLSPTQNRARFRLVSVTLSETVNVILIGIYVSVFCAFSCPLISTLSVSCAYVFLSASLSKLPRSFCLPLKKNHHLLPFHYSLPSCTPISKHSQARPRRSSSLSEKKIWR